MQRAVCFLLLFCATASFAINGTVSTLDGRKLEGEMELTRDGLLVKLPQGEMVTVAASNIALATFSTNAAVAQTKGTGNGLLGIYFASTNFSGVSVIRLDEALDFDWRSEAPALGIQKDQFSVRWMGELEAPTTDAYTIHFGSDEGGRIYLDGKLVGEQWTRRAYEETNFTVNLTAGEKHKLQVEYFDSFGDARARLWWSTPSMPKTIVPRGRLYAASFDAVHKAEIAGTEGLLASYYHSQNFTSYSFTRVDPQIDFDWRGEAPAPGISSNVFSVRWSGNLLVTNSGEYTFYLLAGRPIRFFINDKLMNDPSLAAPQKTCVATLRAGERCEVRLELSATNGAAGAQFLWSGPGLAKSIVPRQHLSPAIAPAGGRQSNANSLWPAGVVFLNGATITAPIQSASDAALRFQGVFSKQSLPLAKVARIHVQPLGSEMAAALPKGRPGVLLRNGDFIDGDFAGIENGRVKITSVLFGNRTFDMAKDVVAIVLRGNEPPMWRYSVSARDGTALYGQSMVIEPKQIAITGAPEFSIMAAEVTQIERRSESLR
jgi:hypothetical protein